MGFKEVGFATAFRMATQAGQVYRCKICGNQVKVVEAGGGVLACCGVPMKLESDG